MATYRDDWRLTACFRGIGASALVGGCAISSSNPSLAQITPDATLGAEPSQVTSPIPGGFQIDGGATRGTNLFHSFSQFSVPTNGIAYFNNASNIQNIIGRVTGASVSNIDGLIAANGTANLFLINPNGIIFGPNARLNVGGSFLASTANSLVFGNGFEFSAANPKTPPLLTINLPLGLQYGASPGRIVNQSTANGFGLQIKPERNVTLTDGSQISANLLGAGKGGGLVVNASDSVQVIGTSADGQFSSGLFAQAYSTATGEAGDLMIATSQLLISEGAQVSASTFGVGKGGNLTVNASDSVSVIGTSADGQFSSKLSAKANRNSTGDAGDLTITTGQLLIQDGAEVSSSTFGAGKGGNLTVNASDSIHVIGTSADGKLFSTLSADAKRNSTGDAGNLTITTGQLLIQDGAEVSSSTSGAGKGGNLTVNTSDSIHVIGTSANDELLSVLTVQANESATGDAGDLTITTGQLLIQDGAFVSSSTFGSGKGGNLTINASDSIRVIGFSADGRFASYLIAQANPNSTGDAGDLTINTSQLLIRDGAQVSTGTFGSGKGGNLIVNAFDWVHVIGTSADNSSFGSNLASQANSTGNAGDLTITTGQLLIRDGAFVSAATLGSGKGGNLTVNASDWVRVIGTSTDGQFFSTLGAYATTGGTAGNLSVKTGQVSVQDGAGVAVSSPFGQAGNMTITADSLTLNQGKLTAVTGKSGADGGANINLKSLDLLRMDNESFISASALEGANGGNVTIDSTFIVATPPTGSKGSDITANAVRGNGGRVNITTQGLFGTQFRPKQTPLNDITASSQFGINGTVTINQPDVDPSRGLTELPTDVVDATRQIDRHCTPARADQRSSFVVTGRGGLPPSPNNPLQGETVITNWVTLDSQEENINRANPHGNSTSTTPKQLVEAQGWVYGADGRVMLTAQAPTVTPESPWQTSPSCLGKLKVKKDSIKPIESYSYGHTHASN